MNTLHIDTRDNKKSIVWVSVDGQEYKAESVPDDSRADVVLRLIANVCDQAGITVQKIERIYCEKGPGSYTGLRVGFAIANTLSLALSIPLNNNKIGTIDYPIYG